jgi:hypothetical protein
MGRGTRVRGYALSIVRDPGVKPRVKGFLPELSVTSALVSAHIGFEPDRTNPNA